MTSFTPNGDGTTNDVRRITIGDGVEKQTRKYGDAFIKAIIEFQRQKLLKKKE
jgi:hypothetical protein